MKYMLGIIFVVLCTAVQAMTGNELLSRCEKVDLPGYISDSAYCIGYIDGATDAQVRKQLARRVYGEGSIWAAIVFGQEYCLRDNVTLGQMRLVFIKFARENPQFLDQPAEGLLESALSRAFPCK